MSKNSIISFKDYNKSGSLNEKKFTSPEEKSFYFCIAALEQFGRDLDIHNIYDVIVKELEESGIDISHVVYNKDTKPY